MNFHIDKWLLENYIMPLLVILTAYIFKVIFTNLSHLFCKSFTNFIKKNDFCLTN